MRLLSAPWVVPIAVAPLREGALLVDAGGEVVAVGPRSELRRRYVHAPEERGAGALLPGLVNAHTHLELAALAGAVPGGDGLVAWATALMRALGGADIGGRVSRARIAEAAAAAASAGTAAVGDVGNSLIAAPCIGRAGLRGTLFHELIGSREAKTGDALADAARELAEGDHGTWPEGLRYVTAPHAPYSVGPDLLRRIFSAVGRRRLPTTIHVAEDPDEIALLRDGGGRWPAVLAAMGVEVASRVPRLGPLAYLASLGAFDTAAPPMLVHMVHAAPEDLQIAARAGSTVVLCPRSNLHIGGQLPDVEAMLAAGVPLALGTDSLASAPDVSLWGEMALLSARFPQLPAMRWLEAATRGGAEALRLSSFGVLAAGKRPGVIDVSLDDLEAPLESLVRNPSPTVRWMVRP
jgi:cytosine/adenosine deaminase-related metal-dependent hydrolase